ASTTGWQSLAGRVLPALSSGHPDRVGLLVGRVGRRLADVWRAADPRLAGRLIAPGALEAGEVSPHLLACDLMVQPSPAGVTCRRSTLMAGLAHGQPIVTATGHASETIWARTGCVALAPSNQPRDLVRETEALMADPARRARLASLARDTYQRDFAPKR